MFVRIVALFIYDKKINSLTKFVPEKLYLLGGDESSSNNGTKGIKRQFSQTQSQPETSEPPASASTTALQSQTMERSVTFTEPKIKVIPPSGRSALLMHMHTEYTSITDELETVCGLLSPPRSPRLLSPPRPEQSPPSKFWSP